MNSKNENYSYVFLKLIIKLYWNFVKNGIFLLDVQQLKKKFISSFTSVGKKGTDIVRMRTTLSILPGERQSSIISANGNDLYFRSLQF